jgi:hypothetical protein
VLLHLLGAQCQVRLNRDAVGAGLKQTREKHLQLCGSAVVQAHRPPRLWPGCLR